MKAEIAEKEREHAMEVKEIRKSLQNEKQILKKECEAMYRRQIDALNEENEMLKRSMRN